jgi:hypothetical protein
MTTKIYGIVEKFSMQPQLIYIGMYWGQQNGSNVIIHSIELGTVYVDGDPYEYYIGRDEHGNLLFEYSKNSVNVHYQY